MAISVSIIMLVAGVISLLNLPVEQYPDIAPPTVYVSTSYTGADADAVLQSVVMPLEESINGVDNMIYMVSSATNDGEAFWQIAQKFLMELNKRPEIAMAYTSYSMNFPQYQVDVDAEKCERAGISSQTVLDVLGGYTGGTYVSNFNKFGKVYRVMSQALHRAQEPMATEPWERVSWADCSSAHWHWSSWCPSSSSCSNGCRRSTCALR